ncbi:DUF2332 domain-containing protein [Intrasporangium sp. YIM S08009]|uniref:DUF2332 domain-containing protein n=1 Tax=Intrasporangium zincisolvens TaxID=3080018 RepID=UPI002B059D91|nr:DUF2332 domain-containing protein [Intrasporangium sp. YIM S08009]
MPPASDRHTSREGDDDGAAERLAHVRRRFREFGAEYASLPLYGSVSRRVAEDPETAGLLVSAQPGQARPVLWFAALHDLVLRRPDVPAARWYASVVGRDALPEGDPWPDVRTTVLDHADELRQLMATRTTQTNEVNRSVYAAAGLAMATTDRPDVPVALVELGASAGLLLGVDRYAVELSSPHGTVVLGDATSPVRCSGVDRAGVGTALHARGAGLPPVRARVGLDLAPVDLDDDEAVRWLEACLWPDVPGRVERFRAARGLLRHDPPLVLAGDMVDGLHDAVGRARSLAGPGAHVVVLTSWALTYLEASRRIGLASVLDAISREVSDLSWLTAEPPGCVPAVPVPDGAGDRGTVVGLRRWRAGREGEPRALGTCHPHGAWVDLSL